MEEQIKQIVDLILQWGPSVVSIIGMIATVIVALKKIGRSNDENLTNTRRLEQKMNEVLIENAELKKTIRKMTNKIYHIKEKSYGEK
jgi:hypothetical protein